MSIQVNKPTQPQPLKDCLSALKEWALPVALVGTMVGTYGASDFSTTLVSGVALSAMGLYAAIDSGKKICERGVKEIDTKEYLKGAIHVASLIFGLAQLNSANNIRLDLSNENEQLKNQLSLRTEQWEFTTLITYKMNFELEKDRRQFLNEVSQNIFNASYMIDRIEFSIEKCNRETLEVKRENCKSDLLESIKNLNTEKLENHRDRFCNEDYKTLCDIFPTIIVGMKKEIEFAKQKYLKT